MLTFTPAGDMWLRRWSVSVYTPGGTALQLSAGVGQPGQTSGAGFESATDPQGRPLAEGLAFRMRSVALDTGVPNHAEITVFNLADATAKRSMNKEFAQVVVQAGYASFIG